MPAGSVGRVVKRLKRNPKDRKKSHKQIIAIAIEKVRNMRKKG